MVSPRKLIGLALAVTAVVIVVGAATSLLVAYKAEEAAGSQPYCIQIADGTSDYRPARSWLDLSSLIMWAKRDGPLYMQHHAILVVGAAANPRLLHWSYRRRAFEPGVLNGQIEGRGPAVTCLPARDFARKRLALVPQSSDSNYLRYPAQGTYRIPSVWQPKWSGGTSPSLLLATTAPDFQPLSRRWSDLAPGERDSNWLFVEWNPEWVLSLIGKAPSGNVVEQSTEFGLSKTKTVTHGRDGKDYVGYGYLVYADGHGVNTTVIGCGMPSDASPKSCQHRFINKGRHFYFRHRPEDVAYWRNMQQRILELMDLFEARDGAS
ncbi:hypothetical protein [Bradyrhizobium cajani]|uniref:Uncharacterized protein n=1 Tax=Bradyrhizobium cajani TaxID=1928661 RepID=A0A844T406_9BRAD|nr:hypothetical protein [Bradyrhizobium cajani]MCP3371608.1 hypothetical protein [Bradyrhizobium cajani]MVT72345.1 hypothetical protein [Bradyrhizobium cajani]